jgi:hypothetical protein
MKYIGILSAMILTALVSVSVRTSAQEKEKSIIRVSLSYIQTNEQAPVLKTSAKRKVGKRYEAIDGVVINLSFMEDSPQGFIGSVKTNKEGIASMVLPDTIRKKLSSLSQFKFIASVTSNDQFDDELTEIFITKSRIELSLQEVDSVRTVEAKLLALREGQWVDVPETEVKLFVKRLYSDYPIGLDAYTTNEGGLVSATYNMNLPGDPHGNLIIGAKVDDNDTYGTIATTKVIKWGVPLKADTSFSKRTLFSTRDKTPIWLLIFPNLIIASVWGFIFYLVILIRRIRKIGIENKNA